MPKTRKNIKNVVRLSTRIYPTKEAGGPAKHAYFLSRNVAGHGVKMINIACVPRGMKAGVVQEHSLFEVHHLSLHALKLSQTSIKSQINFMLNYLVKCTAELIKIHKTHGINLIHAHSPAITGIPAMIFKMFYKIPFIYTYHGLDHKNFLEVFIQFKLINRFAKKIIAITKRIQNFFLHYKLLSPEKILVMPNGIECPEEPKHVKTAKEKNELIRRLAVPGLHVDDFIITYVGHMVFEQKVRGMVDFLEAFNKFLSELEDE
ncbi:MAG: glycosyltransferase, partial [Promethearchaeota archaeon]